MKTSSLKTLATVSIASLLIAAGGITSALASPQGGRHGGPAEGGMMWMGRGMDRMLESAGVGAEQRDQIRQITDAARADLKAQRDAGASLHEQARALFAQPSVDANAAEALRQQMLAQHDRASQRMMQVMLDVSRVLTPEQRQQIADKMQRRHEKMRQGRHERGGRHGG